MACALNESYFGQYPFQFFYSRVIYESLLLYHGQFSEDEQKANER